MFLNYENFFVYINIFLVLLMTYCPHDNNRKHLNTCHFEMLYDSIHSYGGLLYWGEPIWPTGDFKASQWPIQYIASAIQGLYTFVSPPGNPHNVIPNTSAILSLPGDKLGHI
jgi:hypothetical protein